MKQFLWNLLIDVESWKQHHNSTGLQAGSVNSTTANTKAVAADIFLASDGSWSSGLGRMGCREVLRGANESWVSGVSSCFSGERAFLP